MLSDTNVCDVLKTVYAADNSGVDFANQAKLPPTKIYPLISMLQEQHLIEKRNRKYFITIIGRAVYNTKGLIEKALRHYCKLKVIDSHRTARHSCIRTSQDYRYSYRRLSTQRHSD
jgi:predicted methyltransferase